MRVVIVGVEEVAVVGGDEGEVELVGNGLELSAAPAGEGAVVDDLAVEGVTVGCLSELTEKVGKAGQEEKIGPGFCKDVGEGEVGVDVTSGDDFAKIAVALRVLSKQQDRV